MSGAPAGSEPRCFRALASGDLERGCGSQFYAVPSFVFGAIESLVGCLDDPLGLAIAGAGLGHSDAHSHR